MTFPKLFHTHLADRLQKYDTKNETSTSVGKRKKSKSPHEIGLSTDQAQTKKKESDRKQKINHKDNNKLQQRPVTRLMAK